MKDEKAQKQAAREEARAARRRADMEKHTVTCPHCNKPVLDHMTQCPHCKGELTPYGYKPMDEKKKKLFKTVGYTVGIATAAVLVLLLILFK